MTVRCTVRHAHSTGEHSSHDLALAALPRAIESMQDMQKATAETPHYTGTHEGGDSTEFPDGVPGLSAAGHQCDAL